MSVSKSYRDLIIADGAAYFWDFMDQPAATAAPAVGGISGVVYNSPTAAVFNSDCKSLLLNGSNQAVDIQSGIVTNKNCSIEIWIKTSTLGGGISGCKDTNGIGTPNSLDKNIFINTSGKIGFGVWNGSSVVYVITDEIFSDGEFHHVCASMGNSSCALFIDGVLKKTLNYVSVANTPKIAFGYAYVGSGWPATGSNFLKGYISCPAIYNFAMPADMAMRHYVAGMQ